MRTVQQPTDSGLRVCTKCRNEKPVAEFYKAKTGTSNHAVYGGVDMPCKECNRARCRGKQRSPEQRARDAARAKHPDVAEENRLRSAAWYATPRGKEMAKAHAVKNRDKRLAQQKSRYSKDPKMRARIKAASQRLRATPNGRERHNASNRRYKQTEDGKLRGRLNAHRRRERARETDDGTITPESWKHVCAAWLGRCAYCDRERALTVDHLNPLSKGGLHVIANVVPSCQECNVRKNAMGLRRAFARVGCSAARFHDKRVAASKRLDAQRDAA